MAEGRKTGGRKKGVPNKANADLKAVAQKYTTDAVRTLVQIMRAGETEPARVAAAKELLDRGHGKARQPSDITVSDERMVVRMPDKSPDVDAWLSQVPH